MKPEVSIIIPNFNETENLQRGVLSEIASYLKTASFTYEVILSDDGSTDKSLSLLQAFAKNHQPFRVLANPHGGKAQAIWAGVKNAKGGIVLFADMDQSTPLTEIEKLLPWYKKGYDVVFGSRGKLRKNFPFSRQITSWGFRHVRQLFLLRDVVDTQCGFKSMKTDIASRIFPQLEVINRKNTNKGWSVTAYDVEMLFLAEKLGAKLKEVDVAWADMDISTGKSRNFISESTDMLKQILKVKYNDLSGKYLGLVTAV